MGLGYDVLSADNPGLIWCSITGYGQDGPFADRAGYDFVAQGEGGIMSVTGEVDGEPMKVGIAVVDITTALFASNAILAALHARDVSGRGQRIDAALLPSAVAWLANVGSSYLVSGEEPQRYANAHATIVPYQTFKGHDQWFIVGVGNDRQFQALCGLMGHPEIAGDERFATNPRRVANRDALIPLLQQIFETEEASVWLTGMTEAGIPCGPINTVGQALAHPQIEHRGMVVEVPHPTAGSVRVIGPPVAMSGTPAEVRSRPPLLGEHTEEVLRDRVGLTAEEIARLRDGGAV
jgi:formyl-CoA transferase